jgi:rubrerythrin
MSNTQDNIMDAFAGESQANRKYLAFAKKAEEEKMPKIAQLFRAAAEAETIHAHAHLRLAGKIGSTTDNLKAAISGETHEYTDMYPKMIAQAKAEGKTDIARYLEFVSAVEEVHANLYKKALANPDSIANADFHICNVCGYTDEGQVNKCPVCGAGAKAFFRIAV